MKIKILLVLAIAMIFSISTSTWACTAAGPSTHVGNVLTIDLEKNTFTILDAQTVSPVKFQASEDIMEKVANATGTAFVDFEVDGINLVATQVSFN